MPKSEMGQEELMKELQLMFLNRNTYLLQISGKRQEKEEEKIAIKFGRAYNQLVSIVKQHFQQQPMKVTREWINDWAAAFLKDGDIVRIFCRIKAMLQKLNIQLED